MTKKHKVFISYHHANDEDAKRLLVDRFAGAWDAFVDQSVDPEGIEDRGLTSDRIAQIIRDDYIRDATVTVVLVGSHTWQRKHVDWELRSALRATKLNSRTGLLGILAPSYGVPAAARSWDRKRVEGGYQQYWPYNVPSVLWNNIEVGYATMRPWPVSADQLQGWIHEAYLRRFQQPDPTLKGDRFAKNRSGDRWWP